MAYNNNKGANNNRQYNNNKRNNNAKKPMKLVTNISICDIQKNERGMEYSYVSLTELLQELTRVNLFEYISVPVYCRRCDCVEKQEGRTYNGVTPVGFINKITNIGSDTELAAVEVTIYNAFTKYIKDMNNPQVFLKCAVRDGKILNIHNMIICDYDNINDLIQEKTNK